MGFFYYPSVFYSSGHRVHSFTKQFSEKALKTARLTTIIASESIAASMAIILFILRTDIEKANTINAILFLGQFLFFGLFILSAFYIVAGIRKRKSNKDKYKF